MERKQENTTSPDAVINYSETAKGDSEAIE